MRKISRIEPASLRAFARKRVCAYARVSDGKDAMLHSLSAQVSRYSTLIQSRADWDFARVYADEATSGTKDRRAEFSRMLEDCRAGRIDLIITKSVSRFARNTVTLLKTARELKSLGISVYFEEQNIDTLTSDGELMLTILASYAQEESLSASENVKWRIRNGYKEGRPSNHITVYGYACKGGRLTVIAKEAEVVRAIYADYLSGMGVGRIAKKLTSEGVPTKNGGRWEEGTVASILRNEKYKGDSMLQKNFVKDHLTKRQVKNRGELPSYYVKGTHEPIIDEETFTAVRKEAKRRRELHAPSRKPTTSEFSGVIRCGRCGLPFKRNINSAGTKYAKVTWVCRGYNHRGRDFCPAKRIPLDILKEKSAEALDIAAHDADVFKERVSKIVVSDDGVLVFHLRDGTENTVFWKHRSRSESWTDEMRKQASEREQARRDNA